MAGVRNPRHVIDYEGPTTRWEVRTYAEGASPDDTVNLIDVGSGGARRIRTVAPIPSFGVEPYDTRNGAETDYFITWYSEIRAEKGDVLSIPFPAEMLFAPQGAADRLACVPVVASLASGGVTCTFRKGVVDS